MAPERHPEPEARPSLASGVELVGALPSSAFDQPQFLAQRDGQFVQLTEVLYRVLEALDGRRTVAEAAEHLTATTPWAITPDQVLYLIDAKLAPLGLVLRDEAAGSGTGTDSLGASPMATVNRSPFMVMAPVRLVGPAAIKAVTTVTQHLFALPLLGPMVALILAAHGWLFFSHGVGNAFLEVLYAPGLLLLVLVLIAIAALIHELGHASGLRHGGAHARSIGVGVYLVYPAFFTDTSEGYRLSRSAKLRTDLGGIYFHLLFAVALIGIYSVTGWEFLLFGVLLIDLEALRQALPFGRLDGYWILADLTGIPDPFSQLVPFLRGVTARGAPSGMRMPRLRTRVRRVFLGYIALTLPAVVLFLLVLVARLPTLFALLFDAMRLQASQALTALANGDAVTVLLAALQIAFVAFELVATVYILVRLGGQFATGLARWARPTIRRQALGGLVALAVAAGLTFLWGPHVAGLAAGEQGEGVAYIDVRSRSHVEEPVAYDRTPPVGGDHAPVWQNCGYYDAPVPTERAVHSMEHGAVWITYRPDAGGEQLDGLRKLTEGRTHVLVSPLPDNPALIVASAWGRQLLVHDVDDPRLEQFIVAFRLGSNAPERGGPCDGGDGTAIGKPG